MTTPASLPTGHFLPEEAPELIIAAVRHFFSQPVRPETRCDGQDR